MRDTTRLIQLIEAAPWRWAKTYANSWPHEYVLHPEDNVKELFLEYCTRVCSGEAVLGKFFKKENDYLFIGDFKYWTYSRCHEIPMDNPPENYVLNRAPLFRDRRDFDIIYGDTHKYMRENKAEFERKQQSHFDL